MTEKTLPEIYREAAELVLAVGKVEEAFKRINAGECFGYCTMGAVFEAAGELTENGVPTFEFGDDKEGIYTIPVASRLVASGRSADRTDLDYAKNPVMKAWHTIADWNDGDPGEKPTAEDVAALLRETADAVEVTA